MDHTFFLANFCTTSLASSMMASFVPKPVSMNQPSNKGSVCDDPILAPGNYNQPPGGPTQQPPMYDGSPRGMGTSDKKINGNLVPSPAIAGNQQQIQGQVQGRPQNMLSGNSGSNNSSSGSNVVTGNINSSNTGGEPVSPEVLAGSGVRGHPSGSVVNTTSGSLFESKGDLWEPCILRTF